MPGWLSNFLPIALLLVAVAALVARLPKVELGHSPAFLRRRRFNWLPLGLTYAFLYMGRYNLTVAAGAMDELITKKDFGDIFSIGTVTYGLAFLVNGPLTDRLGGRTTILISALGSAACNLAMGWLVHSGRSEGLVPTLSVLYAANMYFQSFGAVSIVKVNAHWFHVRERGVFGGIFGILISLGIYFAYDWGQLIVEHVSVPAVFLIPAAILIVFAALDAWLVFDEPSRTGHPDFDTGDADLSGGERASLVTVAKRMFSSPAIVTIAAIEFCSGYLRQAIMQWYRFFAKQTGSWDDKGDVVTFDNFVAQNWGMLLCVAGICGGVFAGTISDRVFGSRRGPVSAVLYGAMLIGSCAAWFLLESAWLGYVMVLMSLCIIGVHGMLSGTASMDFGGKKNAGVAVGIIDGFVYLGTAAQAVLLGNLLPKDGTEEAQDPSAWSDWPLAMIPVALLGLILAARLWNARPRGGGH
jgi:OPA family glycerol-3-phosphate transporter-like MFS transporter